MIDWRANDVSGVEIASGASEIDLTTAPADGICFRSPQGTPSGWIAIDDLIIEG